MSPALKPVPDSKSFHEPELGIDAIVPPRTDLDGDATLQSELDRILARKPVAKPTGAGLNAANFNALNLVALDPDAVTVNEEGFSWAPDPSDDKAVASARKINQTLASSQWLDKARQDKKSKSRSNALAWVMTLAIGAMVLGASAYVLLGWTPNFESAAALLSQWKT